MISCKCITYGRVEYLQEAIYSFLQQEYENKELIIVNDYAHQKLVFNHPQVHIYNFDEQFPTVGHKDNFAVSKCSGDIIALWDDDDIALPNHLRNIEMYIQGYDYLQWNRGFYAEAFTIQNLCSIGVSGMAYRKSAWEKAGKMPSHNAGYDTLFIERMNRAGCNPIYAEPEEPGFIYMWANGVYHMSGLGMDTPERPNALIRHREFIEGKRLRGEIPTGLIELKPSWRKDYFEEAKKYMEMLNFKEPQLNLHEDISMRDKIKEIIQSWAISVNPTDEQKYKAEVRLAVCMNACDFYRESPIRHCKLCLCPLAKKVYSPIDTNPCPKNKWPI